MEIKEYKQEINITPELQGRIDELIGHYPADKKKSAMLPVLHAVQDAHDNWLSVGLMNKVAEILEVSPIEVYEVVTFIRCSIRNLEVNIHLNFAGHLAVLFVEERI